MRKLLVFHSGYGCDTGCCGHVVELYQDDKIESHSFEFDHPYSNEPEELRRFAEDMIRKFYSEEHIADLDWDACEIQDTERCW